MIFAGGTACIVLPEGSVTILPDGSEIVARPEPTDEYAARAAALGYSDPVEMTRAHDWLHCWMAEALGLPYSPALWAAAHPLEERDHAAIADEESMVLEGQAWTNGKAEAPWLFLAKLRASVKARTEVTE